MKKLIVALIILPVVLLIGCPMGKTIAKSAIDITLASCIAENADVSDEPALREICKWTDEFGPLVKELLAARRKGVAKAAKAGACGPGASATDGGK